MLGGRPARFLFSSPVCGSIVRVINSLANAASSARNPALSRTYQLSLLLLKFSEMFDAMFVNK
jgi:hypothetical protein